MLKETKIFF